MTLVVRCGFTIRYTRNPEIAAVASTIKITNARIAVINFAYHVVGYLSWLRMDIRRVRRQADRAAGSRDSILS
jgi:hypothetical protein